ncbi:MAG: hypothetical protein F6J93_34800 [Oscillatoria sp. SIO1A7]|nr:hypothetical protein [Oscillatoria sp. SIO1A7]
MRFSKCSVAFWDASPRTEVSDRGTEIVLGMLSPPTFRSLDLFEKRYICQILAISFNGRAPPPPGVIGKGRAFAPPPLLALRHPANTASGTGAARSGRQPGVTPNAPSSEQEDLYGYHSINCLRRYNRSRLP